MQSLPSAKGEQHPTAAVERARRVLVALTLAIGVAPGESKKLDGGVGVDARATMR